MDTNQKAMAKALQAIRKLAYDATSHKMKSLKAPKKEEETGEEPEMPSKSSDKERLLKLAKEV